MYLRSLIQPRIEAKDTDVQVLDWLRQGVAQARDVPWKDYMLWLSAVGGMRKLRLAVANEALGDDVRNAADLAIVMARSGRDLSLSDPDVRAALAPLVGEGKPFNAGERNSLLAKSDVSLPRWEHPDNQPLLLPTNAPIKGEPTLEHIAKARAA